MKILLASIYPYVFFLLYLTIPFDNYIRALPNILLGILVVAFPFVVSKDDFRKLKKVPTLIFVALFSYLIISSLISDRIDEDMSVLTKILIAMGLMILYIPVQDFRKVSRAIIFSSLAAIIFSVIKIIMWANSGGEFEFGSSAGMIEALLVDRIYLGLLSTLSMIISFRFIRDEYHPQNGYYIANILVNALFVLLIASRITIIALAVLFVIGQFYRRRKGVQILLASAIIALIVTVVFLVSTNFQRQVFYRTDYDSNKPFVENAMEKEPRALIWDCAAKVADQNPPGLWGLGFKNTNELLVASYAANIEDPIKRERFGIKKYNSHNQFIDMYLASGWVGFLLFAGFIAVLFFRNRKEFFPTALLISLVLFALVENLFHRQIGAYYVGFILIILSIKNHLDEKAKTNEQ